VSDEVEVIKSLHAIAVRTRIGVMRRFPQYETALQHVHFEWSRNMTRAAGNARDNGRVRFSIPIWTDKRNKRDREARFRNTVLHELAHVIVGVRNRHNVLWRRCAKAIGCTGEVYHELATPERRRPKRNNEWPCSVCGQPMLLGPGQHRLAKYEGRQYRHRSC
jgi:hypothetical protein